MILSDLEGFHTLLLGVYVPQKCVRPSHASPTTPPISQHYPYHHINPNLFRSDTWMFNNYDFQSWRSLPRMFATMISPTFLAWSLSLRFTSNYIPQTILFPSINIQGLIISTVRKLAVQTLLKTHIRNQLFCKVRCPFYACEHKQFWLYSLEQHFCHQ